HGGDDQAVYAYAREDLDTWAFTLDRPLDNGCFGENLTTAQLDLTGPSSANAGESAMCWCSRSPARGSPAARSPAGSASAAGSGPSRAPCAPGPTYASSSPGGCSMETRSLSSA